MDRFARKTLVSLLGLSLLTAVPLLSAAKRADWWLLPAGPESLPALRSSGARVLGFQPGQGYLFEFSSSAQGGSRAALLRLGARRQMASERMATGLKARFDKSSGAMLSVELLGPPGSDPQLLVQALRKHSDAAALLHPPIVGRMPVVQVELPRSRAQQAVEALADNGQILWADVYSPMEWLNKDSVEPIQANTTTTLALGALPSVTPIWDQGIVGSGQIVAVADQGLDRNEEWFTQYDNGVSVNTEITAAEVTTPPAPGSFHPQRKVVAYWIMPGATAYDNGISSSPFHGTHVTGTVAGDKGNASTPLLANYDDGDGMAPNARILYQDLGDDTTGLLAGAGGPPMWEQAVTAGAFISSNSYGSRPVPGGAAYPTGSALLDDFLWRNPDLLIVVAAGNAGGSMTINHPGSAKHALTVGALEHGASLSVASFSSRGPTEDGRIKPDLMAPGTAIRSAGGDTNNDSPDNASLRTISGTSMSTPTVAGAAALARQYFEAGFYPGGSANAADGQRPSGPLLKALLLNGTRTYADTPAVDTGWGRVWLDSNLYFAGEARDVRVWDLDHEAGLGSGEMDEYGLRVEAGQELRATLVWYDPAALPGDGPALVNDLDLELVTPGNTLLGNVFVNGQSSIGGSPDTLNTVEQVRLTSPLAGDYSLRVRATATPGNGEPGSDRQAYALVVSSARCDSLVSTAPSIALSTDGAGVHLSYAAQANADHYQIYRSAGSCAADPTGLRLIDTTDGLTFTDTVTQGGFEYAYHLRAVDACGEGPLSTCQSIVSQAPCTLPPEFDVESVTLQMAGDFCAASLDWAAATASCPGASVSHQVYRSTDPFFEPGPTNLIADNLDATALLDLGPAPAVSHFYRIRAIDDLGNASAFSAPLMYPAVATTNSPGNYDDGAESLALARLDPPWQLTASQAASGSRSYHNAADGGGYLPNTCAALTTPPIQLQAGTPQLSYAALFDLELDFDGVVVEISNNGGASWQDLPPDSGYPGDFSQTGTEPINACGYSVSQGAFNGSNAVFETFTSTLTAFAGQTIQLRWRFSSDPGLELEGFYLDDIHVSDASQPQACTADELLFLDGFE